MGDSGWLLIGGRGVIACVCMCVCVCPPTLYSTAAFEPQNTCAVEDQP